MVLFDKDLVVYLPFSEGSGAKVFDRSKYQNNGVVDGAVFVRAFDEVVEASWLAGWNGKRIRIIIDADDIDAGLTDFPILIALGTSVGIDSDDISSVFDELTADGNRLKIAVTTSNGQTQCYVEIEYWDDATETAYLWVKVPNIDDTNDTILYLYYDVTHADNTTYVGDPNSVAAENVWDGNYKLVDHMQDDPDNAHTRDSTTNDNDGAKVGANEPIEDSDGKIGKCQLFDGLNEMIDVGDITVNAIVTFEMWIKPTLEQNQVIIRKVDEFIIRDTVDDYSFYGNSGGFGSDTSPSFTGLNTWNYVTAVWNGTTLEAYINGTSLGTPINLGAIVDTANPIQIGAAYFAAFFKGYIDEVRVSASARSSAWIRASYESSRDHMLTFEGERNYTECNWRFGEALDFDGTNDVITISDSPSLRIYEDLTIGAWIQISSYSTYHPILAKQQAPASNNAYEFRVDQNTGRLAFSHCNAITGETFTSDSAVGLDEFVHVVVTREGNTVKFYRNGIEIGEGTTTFTPTGLGTLYIGTRQDNFAYFDGLMDEIRIYNRILTPAEIRTLYNEKRVD